MRNETANFVRILTALGALTLFSSLLFVANTHLLHTLQQRQAVSRQNFYPNPPTHISSTMSNTMKRNHSQSPTDIGASTMPAMKKVRLELGRAAGFVDKDVVLNISRQSSKSNATSPSRGLRHFSMKVCEKVEEKGTTSYNEVADEVSCMYDVMPCRHHRLLQLYPT